MINMHVYLLEKYRSPPLLTLICLLFEAFLVFSMLAHSCVNHPFNCKCSVYHKLPVMITILVAY